MARSDAMTLAIVDDDDDVRAALHRLLRAMGHQVLQFSSAEAFEASGVAVDCAIIDMRLPGLNGVELCERLQQRRVPLPVVLVTGDAHRLGDDLPSTAPDTPLLNKPFDEASLVAAIAGAIGGVAARHAG